MKKVLILGMSATLGGVETYLYNLAKNINRDKYTFDYLIIGNEKSVFEDELNALERDGENHFFRALNIKKNPMSGKKWLKNFYAEHSYDYIYI